MAFCAQCGSPLESAAQGGFCPACGAPAGPGTAPPPSSPATAPPATAPLEENVIHALCYALGPLTGVLFLALEPYNRNRTTRFHALQSIFVWVAWMAGFAILSFLAYTPFIGIVFTLVILMYPVGGLLLWLFLMFKAYNKERFVVPVLGTLAESRA